eukprot:9492337-Pyramimonas_sp.AAC.1
MNSRTARVRPVPPLCDPIHGPWAILLCFVWIQPSGPRSSRLPCLNDDAPTVATTVQRRPPASSLLGTVEGVEIVLLQEAQCIDGGSLGQSWRIVSSECRRACIMHNSLHGCRQVLRDVAVTLQRLSTDFGVRDVVLGGWPGGGGRGDLVR